MLTCICGSGIGEYLQAVSPPHKYDLYDASRLLTELGPYEHLERILRLCFAHYARNIQKTTVSKEVKDAMFSLHGVIHKDGTEEAWKATLSFIENEGKKAGSGAYCSYNLIQPFTDHI